jgi:hypothetical protein
MARPSLGGAIAVLAAAGGLLAGQIGASASATYASTAVGYDISYPQCTAAYPNGSFGIVGVNQGYPFSYYNSCFSSEWAYASTTPSASLYINTGYDPSYTNSTDGRHATADCLSKSSTIRGSSSQQKAWAVGCSEVQRSVGYASCQNPTAPSVCGNVVQPAAWWLDVETANSWCGRPGTRCKDLTLNQYTLQGAIDTLETATQNPSGAPVGIYSTPSAWSTIVGSNSVTNVAANWRATGLTSDSQAQAYCSGNGFTRLASGSYPPVWLVQFLPGGYDADYAC